jgi:hypothetical protein
LLENRDLGDKPLKMLKGKVCVQVVPVGVNRGWLTEMTRSAFRAGPSRILLEAIIRQRRPVTRAVTAERAIAKADPDAITDSEDDNMSYLLQKRPRSSDQEEPIPTNMRSPWTCEYLDSITRTLLKALDERGVSIVAKNPPTSGGESIADADAETQSMETTPTSEQRQSAQTEPQGQTSETPQPQQQQQQQQPPVAPPAQAEPPAMDQQQQQQPVSVVLSDDDDDDELTDDEAESRRLRSVASQTAGENSDIIRLDEAGDEASVIETRRIRSKGITAQVAEHFRLYPEESEKPASEARDLEAGIESDTTEEDY